MHYWPQWSLHTYTHIYIYICIFTHIETYADSKFIILWKWRSHHYCRWKKACTSWSLVVTTIPDSNRINRKTSTNWCRISSVYSMSSYVIMIAWPSGNRNTLEATWTFLLESRSGNHWDILGTLVQTSKQFAATEKFWGATLHIPASKCLLLKLWPDPILNSRII